MLLAARVPLPSNLLGSAVGALPMAAVAAGIGAAWRQWREHGSRPGWLTLAGLVVAAAIQVAAAVAARRAFVRSTRG
jgi:hypothetical protein